MNFVYFVTFSGTNTLQPILNLGIKGNMILETRAKVAISFSSFLFWRYAYLFQTLLLSLQCEQKEMIVKKHENKNQYPRTLQYFSFLTLWAPVVNMLEFASSVCSPCPKQAPVAEFWLKWSLKLVSLKLSLS